MSEERSSRDQIEQRLKAIEERFRIAQVAGGIGWFEWDLVTDAWEWTPHVAILFGFDPETPRPRVRDHALHLGRGEHCVAMRDAGRGQRGSRW